MNDAALVAKNGLVIWNIHVQWWSLVGHWGMVTVKEAGSCDSHWLLLTIFENRILNVKWIWCLENLVGTVHFVYLGLGAVLVQRNEVIWLSLFQASYRVCSNSYLLLPYCLHFRLKQAPELVLASLSLVIKQFRKNSLARSEWLSFDSPLHNSLLSLFLVSFHDFVCLGAVEIVIILSLSLVV